MNQLLGGIALAALAPGSFAPAGVGPENTSLVFAPRSDSALEKRLDFGLRLEWRRFTLDGAQIDAQLLPVRLESSVRLVDRYAAVARGAPRDFVRRFEQLSGRWWHGDRATEIDGFHALTGAGVRFEWDAELGEYARSWVDEPRRSGLTCVAEDLDFRGLLPASAVRVDDRWTARGPAVIDALWASTELGLCGAPRTSIYDRLVQDLLVPPLRSTAAQTLRIECAYSGLAPARDGDVHRIALRVDERIERDLADLANEFLDAGSLVAMPAPVEQLTTRWTLEGTGALDWDVAAGHFASFELALRLTLDVQCVLRFGSERYVIDEMSWTGAADWSASGQRREDK